MRTFLLLCLLALLVQKLQAQNADSIIYYRALEAFYMEVKPTKTNPCITIRLDELAEPVYLGLYRGREKDSIDSQTLERFIRPADAIDIGKHADNIKNTLGRQLDYILLDENRMKSFYGNRFWKKFFKAYPCSLGLVSLSQVEYNAEKTRAIVYLENMFHGLAGGGYVTILKLKYNDWQIVEQFCIVDM